MEITEEMRDRMFEKWLSGQPIGGDPDDNYRSSLEREFCVGFGTGYKEGSKDSFKAAFDFLLPILIKQNEALKQIVDMDYGRDKCDYEYLPEKIADQTLAFVEQEIKKMGEV